MRAIRAACTALARRSTPQRRAKPGRGWLCALIALLFPLGAHAAWLLHPSAAPIVPGQPVDLELLITNESDAPIDATIPKRLPARLTTGSGTVAVELLAVTPGTAGAAESAAESAPVSARSAPLAPGRFRKHHLRLILPADTQGPVALALTPEATAGQSPVRVVFIVPPPAALAGTPPHEASAPAPRATGEHVLHTADSVPPPALQTHEPLYFLVGRRNGVTSARFQISLKYRLFDERSWIGDIAPVDKLYLGYTQTSIWDLSEDSSPFRDTTYRPSLFYMDPDLWTSADGRHALGLSAGLEHASNGRGGSDSRSINIAFVQPTWRKFIGDGRWYVSVAPKLWTYLDKDDNPDIAEYAGYGRLDLHLGRVDGWLFSAGLRKGTHAMGALQLDASYPLRRPFFANAGGYIHFQYFNGYGENLLAYDRKGPAQFRIGVSIVR